MPEVTTPHASCAGRMRRTAMCSTYLLPISIMSNFSARLLGGIPVPRGLAVALLFAVATPALAQERTADALAGILTSSQVHLRADAVARLNALPLEELTPFARAKLVALLDAEAMKSMPAPEEVRSEEDERYGEYLLDLVDVVLKLRDPGSLRGMALLGIHSGLDAQRYVASFGSQSLPLLDQAWRDDPDVRADVMGTWGFMLAGTGSLSEPEKDKLLSAIISLADDHPIYVASAARTAPLPVLAPVLADLAASATSGVVRSRTEKAVQELAPLRGAMSPNGLLRDTERIQRSFCAVPGLVVKPPHGHLNRPAACGKIGADFEAARAALNTGRPDDARAALRSAAATAADARASGVFTAAEAALVEGNALYLSSRI